MGMMKVPRMCAIKFRTDEIRWRATAISCPHANNPKFQISRKLSWYSHCNTRALFVHRHDGLAGVDNGIDDGAAGNEPAGEGQEEKDEGDAEKGDDSLIKVVLLNTLKHVFVKIHHTSSARKRNVVGGHSFTERTVGILSNRRNYFRLKRRLGRKRKNFGRMRKRRLIPSSRTTKL